MVDVRSTKACIAAPKLDWQEDHEEGVRPKVGSVSKVHVERW